jgi:hypothetical protein
MKTAMKLVNKKMNNKGMTLIEALISSVILFVVLYAASTAFLETKKQDILMSVKEDSSSLSEELASISKGVSCGILKLKNSSTSSMAVPGSFFSDPKNTMPLNGAAGADGLMSDQLQIVKGQTYGKVKITSVEIGPRLLPQTMPPTFAYIAKSPQVVFAQLVVKFQNNSGTAANPAIGAVVTEEARRDVVLLLDTTGTSIINCSSLEQASAVEDSCSAFGGVWDSATMNCQLQNNIQPSGVPNTCPYNDSCNADPQFKL